MSKDKIILRYRELKGYKYDVQDTVAVDTEIEGIETHIYGYRKPMITLWPSGRLFIFPPYAWDGPSFLAIDTKNAMRGSLVHDALYQLFREGKLDRKYRKRADELLRDICIEDGMSKVRAKTWYWFVRMLAKKSSMPRKKPRGKIVEILEVLNTPSNKGKKIN